MSLSSQVKQLQGSLGVLLRRQEVFEEKVFESLGISAKTELLPPIAKLLGELRSFQAKMLALNRSRLRICDYIKSCEITEPMMEACVLGMKL